MQRQGAVVPRDAGAYAWWSLAAAAAGVPLVLLDGPGAVMAAALAVVLVVIARIDLSRMVIYDVLSLPLIPAGLLTTWFTDPDATAAHTAAAVAAPAAVWALTRVYRRLRGLDGLGGGDLRLLAVAGAWVGPAGLPAVLLTASGLGLVTAAVLVACGRAGWNDRIPFAPALCGAIWLTLVAPGAFPW